MKNPLRYTTNKQRIIVAAIVGPIAGIIIGIIYNYISNIFTYKLNFRFEFSIVFIFLGYLLGMTIQKLGRGVTKEYSIIAGVSAVIMIVVADWFSFYEVFGFFNFIQFALTVYIQPLFELSITDLYGALNLFLTYLFRYWAITTAIKYSRITNY